MGADKVDEMFKEAKSLYLLNHPNIIKLIIVFTVRHHLILMIEHMPGGDLS